VLEYFNASPDEYLAIWTANASGALKLVGEAYPFAPGTRFLITFDNHNSVNGIREFARAKGATLQYLPVLPASMRVDEAQLMAALDQAQPGAPNLFAYPAQSNFSGVQHPLEWIEAARARGWDVLVDCAAFAPTNRLDLGRWHPDFVPLSFYKIFGYPTGVGCLLARKTALRRLRRPWFAGGTIFAVTVQGDGYYLAEGEAGFEDGTLNYLNLPAVEIGLNHVEAAGVDRIHERVMCLTGWLLDRLVQLKHGNGRPLVRIYGPPGRHMRGGTIALNFLDPAGHIVDERIVDRVANRAMISLSTGCFCNPGAGEVAFHIPREPLVDSFTSDVGMSYDEFLTVLGLESAGAVRASFGIASNFADAYRFLEFAKGFVDLFPDTTGLPPREHC
jgi:selenocysteine lyase/cysteine desulfurase